MQKLAAELFGAFFLGFAGTGAIVIDDVSNGVVTHIGIALTFGLVVLSLIYALGDVSGAHFNPAVTMGFGWLDGFLRNQFHPIMWIYLTAPVLGALLSVLSCRCVQEEGCCPITPKPMLPTSTKA